jgi:hypothetical protein
MRFFNFATATLLQLGFLLCLTMGPAKANCGPDLDREYDRCWNMQHCMGSCPRDRACRSILKEGLQCYAARDAAFKIEKEKEIQEDLIREARDPGIPCLDAKTCFPTFEPKSCFGFVPGARAPYTEDMLNSHSQQCRNEIRELLAAKRRVKALPTLTPQEAERESHMMPDSPTLNTRGNLKDLELRILKEKETDADRNAKRRDFQAREVADFMAACGPNAKPDVRVMCPGMRHVFMRKANAGDSVARCLVKGNSNCVN